MLSTRRKKELIGVLCIALAGLLALAFISYTPADRASVSTLMASGEAGAGPGVQNWLGIVGAFLAWVFVPSFMGYPALVLCGLVGWVGLRLVWHRPLAPLLGPALNVLGLAIFVCVFMGWISIAFDVPMLRWGGALGVSLAGLFARLLGVAGTFLILVVVAVVGGLLYSEGSVQGAADRFVKDATAAGIATWQGAQYAVRWARARYADTQTPPPGSTSSNADEADSEADADTQQQPKIEDPTAPKASGFRLVRADAKDDASANDSSEPPEGEASDRASETSQPESAASPPRAQPTPNSDASNSDAPDANAPAEDAPAQDASGEAASGEDNVIRFDDVRSRIRQVQERVQQKRLKRRREEQQQAEQNNRTSESDGQPKPETPDSASPAPARSDASTDASSGARADDPSTKAPASTPESDPASDAPEPSHPPKSERLPNSVPADPDTPHDIDMDVQRAAPVSEAEPKPESPRGAYTPPPLDLLDPSTDQDPAVDYEELEANKQTLLDKLATHNIEIEDIRAVVGPTVTRYELTPAPGIKVSRIKSLENDLAMAMAAKGIRVLAPIPGKSAVGVEVPNRTRTLVRLRDVIGSATFQENDAELPLPLGVSIEGDVFVTDLTKMPHLLVAGATGSGKSVGLNALIMGMIYACDPTDVKFVIIDPKKIELQQYALLKDHFMAHPADVDDAVITNVDEACGVLKSCEHEMEKRYSLLQEARVRNIRAYNRKWEAGDLEAGNGHQKLPYVVVVVDELADLMMTAGDDIEGPIARLAQKARAVGIHLVLATQRPSVDVITGLIKANFPSRMAYEVASRVDSRTILDQIGAERLVGNGDLLFLRGSALQRLQGPFVSVEEVERINGFIAEQPPSAPYELPSLQDAGHGPDVLLGVEDTDELFEEAAYIIVRRQQGSVSLLQRKLSIGYTRAGRIVDQLEEAGIVGPFAGTQAREVLVGSEDELDRLFAEAE